MASSGKTGSKKSLTKKFGTIDPYQEDLISGSDYYDQPRDGAKSIQKFHATNDPIFMIERGEMR